MPNDYFQFKQFTIFQDRCAMKVGTDGVLLGAWTQVDNAKRILDIGTGTGLLALILAQRSSAEIDAIEIDHDAAFQAKENVIQSSWSDRIQVIHISLQDFVQEKRKYDLIVVNPPYFTDALQAPDPRRSLARHNHQLSQELLVEGVHELLDEEGRFTIILPEINFLSFLTLCEKFHLAVSYQTNVYSKPGSPCIRVLAEFSFNPPAGSVDDLIIETDGRHGYSPRFTELVKAYYLKL